nr:EboA domain-containing protein [Streptomyces sp. NRRL WC-3742]
MESDPATLTALFPVAARSSGPEQGEAARSRLVLALPAQGAELAKILDGLYRDGDPAERLAVLRTLPLLDQSGRLGPEALPLVADALRTNDARLVTAAMGPYAARYLGQSAWRQGVLKCLFMGVSLDTVAGLARRTDSELLRMFRAFAAERTAAGRPVPLDLRIQLDDGDALSAGNSVRRDGS